MGHAVFLACRSTTTLASLSVCIARVGWCMVQLGGKLVCNEFFARHAPFRVPQTAKAKESFLCQPANYLCHWNRKVITDISVKSCLGTRLVIVACRCYVFPRHVLLGTSSRSPEQATGYSCVSMLGMVGVGRQWPCPKPAAWRGNLGRGRKYFIGAGCSQQ